MVGLVAITAVLLGIAREVSLLPLRRPIVVISQTAILLGAERLGRGAAAASGSGFTAGDLAGILTAGEFTSDDWADVV